MTRLLFALVATAAVVTFASACGGGGEKEPPTTPSPPARSGVNFTLVYQGREYVRSTAVTPAVDASVLEPAGAADQPAADGGEVRLFRLAGDTSGALYAAVDPATGAAGDVVGPWVPAAAPGEGGGQSAPGAPPGSVPGSPPTDATPTLPGNPAPPPGDVISITVSPGEATATAGWATAGPGIPWPQPSPEPSAAIEAARRALAQRLGVGIDAVQVVSVEFVEWPDGCLGAGLPGEACTMLITPGFRVTLAAGGDLYVYHTDTGGLRVRPETAPPAPVPPPAPPPGSAPGAPPALP